jgi:butyryl-CoA dehydrogenase
LDGYTRDFPVEQHWRDNRLNMIHEGTHGVQALDLLGRKVLLEGGRALKLWQQRVQDTIERASRFPELGQQVESLSEALRRVLDATRAAWTSGDPQQALLNATPYMQAFGHVVVAWLWLDVAIASGGATNPATDFNRGKIQAARYFFHYELPKVDAWLRVVESCEATCRDMADAWF